MKVFYKFSIFFAVSALFLAVGLLIYRSHQGTKLSELIAYEKGERRLMFENFLRLKGWSLEVLAGDYTYWDELVNFIDGTQDIQWAHELLDSALTSYRANALWVYRKNSSLVYSTTNLRGRSLTQLPISRELIARLFSESRFCHFFANTPHGLMEIRGATVHPSADVDRRTPPRGYFFVGAVWDRAYLVELSKCIAGRVDLIPATGNAREEEKRDLKEGWISFSTPLRGGDDAVLARVQVRIRSSLIQNYHLRAKGEAAAIIAFLSALGAFLFWFFRRSIKTPLASLSTTLKTQDPSHLKGLEGDESEFGELAQLLSDSLRQKEAINREVTERRRAEEALRDSEERYRTLFQDSRDTVYITTPEGSILDINQAGLDLFGYGREEMLGLNVRNLYANAVERTTFVEEISNEGFVRDYEIEFRRKDGSPINGLVTAVLRRDQAGRPQQYRGIVRDITERKRTEDALRRNEERYRAVMEQSPDAIYLVDRETRCVIEANPAFAHLLGHPPSEIIGMSVYDFIAADRNDIDRVFANMEQEGSLFIERRLRRKDGSLVEARISATIITYGDRKVNCTIAHDLTANKRAEEALRDSEARYRAIMEQSADGIYLVDVEGKHILEANRAFSRLIGYPPQEIPGMSIHKFILADREDIEQRFHQILTSSSSFSFERKFLKKDNTLVDVWVTVSVVSYGARKVACGLVRDLTERKLLEEGRTQLIRELQEALANVRTLRGLVPICSSCKKIRDDRGYWQQVETYVHEHSEAEFSHGLCPDCVGKFFPQPESFVTESPPRTRR